jgi:hypothetical protein
MIGTLHIVLAMKPLEGNFTQNALKHGVAGLNIDGSRISGPKGDGVWGTSNKTIDQDGKFNASPTMGEYRREAHAGGRWPSNVVLGHLEGCRCVGNKKVAGEKFRGLKGTKARSWKNQSVDGINRVGHADADGKETIEAWECQEGCPISEMDKQSGVRKTTWVSKSHKNNRKDGFLGAVGHPGEQGFNDTGGASRFFKQVRGI